ncbi:MAG: hypothetical protein ACOYOH_00320 [Paracraurococcus sp.]
MSTIGMVIDDMAALVVEFDKLLATDTAKQAPAIARDLGAEPQFDAAMAKAGGVVGDISRWVGRAFEVAVTADAAIAIFGMLPGVVHGFGEAVRSAGQQAQLMDIGLEGLGGIAEQVNGSVESVAGVLQVGVDAADTALAFVNPPALGRLQVSLHRLAEDLATLGKPLPAIAAPKPQP